MKNSNIRLQILLDLYLADKATALEKDELWDYIHDPLYTDDLEILLGEAYMSDQQGKEMTAIQKSMMLDKIFEEDKAVQKGKFRIWSRVAAIAAVLATIVIGAGIFYYNQYKLTDQVHQVAYKTDIAPGKLSATLTLGNGKKIQLSAASKGLLAEETGVTITKATDGQLVYELNKPGQSTENNINTLSTARGETYRVRLPDGSLVWLNAASSLTYAFSLNDIGKRWVKLSGEAYFEIAKDKKHPFVVKTDHQEVEVLGTHFNVNSYDDEPVVSTTLLEGSVRVSAAGAEKLLRPGQEAKLGANGLVVAPANMAMATAWKNGEMVFKKTDIQRVMRQISRWYNIEVEYPHQMPDYTITGEVSREESLSSILKVLELSDVHFELKGRKLLILP